MKRVWPPSSSLPRELMPHDDEALVAGLTGHARRNARRHRTRAAGLRGCLLLIFLALLAACEGMPARARDDSRPALTAERITRLLQVSEQLRPKHADLAWYLDDGNITVGYDFTALRMVPAVNMVGEDGVAALASVGEDPEAFVRDLFWMRLTASAVRYERTVDEKMRQIRSADGKMRVLSLVATETRAHIGDMRILLRLHARIGRDEEAAVRARLAEIYGVAFKRRYPRRRTNDSAAHRPDSIARANGVPPR